MQTQTHTIAATPYHTRLDGNRPRTNYASAQSAEHIRFADLFAAFDASAAAIAVSYGVHVQSITPTIGVWLGDFEPSRLITVTGNEFAVSAYASALRVAWNQDAVAGFTADPLGADAEVTIALRPNAPRAAIVDALRDALGTDAGGTFDGDALRVFVQGSDTAQVQALAGIAQQFGNGDAPRITPGVGLYVAA